MKIYSLLVAGVLCFLVTPIIQAAGVQKPYSAPAVERQNVFEFTESPSVKTLGNDKYEISFAVKGFCDVTVAVVDGKGKVVRHLASGVLGANAPMPFQKNSYKQTIYWKGKDDLGVYIKAPEKLKVRVMLGLKPVYDKRLGGTSPHNIPGFVSGIAIGPEGAIVLSKKWRLHARHFDHDGNYKKTLLPPAANTSPKDRAGWGYIEYEPGQKALHGPNVYRTVADRGELFWGVDRGGLADVQPAIHDGKMYFLGFNAEIEHDPAPMYYLNTDGSSDYKGMRGTFFYKSFQRNPRLAISPDGKWIYMSGVNSGDQFRSGNPVIVRRDLNGDKLAVPFVGKLNKKKRGGFAPGSDNESLNMPAGIACDGQGRLYVCDLGNNRIQIYSPEGKYLKTLPVDRPLLIQVHRKTGAIYVLHTARSKGKSLGRITKLKSFADPSKQFHFDGVVAGLFALDSWSKKPRLWLAGGKTGGGTGGHGMTGGSQSVVIYEDGGKGLKQIMDFDKRASKDDGPNYYGKWMDEKGGSSGYTRLDVDPIREQAYYHSRFIFDLKTGRFLSKWNAAPHRALIEDVAFDKRGFMHIHFNPGFYMPGVGRVDLSRPTKYPETNTTPPEMRNCIYYPPVPYDYGVVGTAGKKGVYWQGLLPVRDQKGAHWFQFGNGVNMRGDIAVASQIYYVPKMEEGVMKQLNSGMAQRQRSMGLSSTGGITFSKFMKEIQEKQKRGEEVYSIKRRPGIPLAGSTLWVFESSGELRQECAAVIGGDVNGVEIDDNGDLYVLTNKLRVLKDGPFLAGKGGSYGGKAHKHNPNPLTGTLMKTRGKNVSILLGVSPVLMTAHPARPYELITTGYGANTYDKRRLTWIEGAKWLYAGVSPIRFRGCKCPSIRFTTDWYKRSFAPEAYRHSIGVLDTNGNLILHFGRYGNFDSANGKKSLVPLGGDEISVFHPRAVAATDNYIVYSNWGERVQVLKITYHAEKTISIRAKK